MAHTVPEITPNRCLNRDSASPEAACTLCSGICPADAIALDAQSMPQLDAEACTGCAACVRTCPADAIDLETVDAAALLQQAGQLALQGLGEISAACQAVEQPGPALRIPCHAAWDPLLLAAMAAEGVRSLHLDGINRCESCPVKFGATMMQQCEKDYDALSKGLSVRLRFDRSDKAAAAQTAGGPAGEAEPPRRAFFRTLIPSLAQGAAVATAHISHAAGQAVRNELQNDEAANPALPVRLRLFLRALPRLKPSFTPVPATPGLPLGAMQADERCTACRQCIELCPTQALSGRNFGTNMVLEFQPDACIGCGKCVVLCPEHALESLPGISLPPLLARRTRPLVMVPASGEEKS